MSERDIDKLKNRELYWEIKAKLKLVIDQRLKPNEDEKSNIYALLKTGGIDYDKEERIKEKEKE